MSIKALPEAGELPLLFAIRSQFKKEKNKWVRRSRRFIADPKVLLKKLPKFFHSQKTQDRILVEEKISWRSPSPSCALALKPGELVRIKPHAEIQKNLDEKNRFEGLAYLPTVMNKYCGGIYRVRKRVELFFNENRWQFMKLRNVVILDEVYCESSREGDEDWSGCDRTCFLFWKVAWLERVADESRP